MEPETYLVISAIVWLAIAILGAWVGALRGRAIVGFCIACFCGVPGLLLIFALPRKSRDPSDESLG